MNAIQDTIAGKLLTIAAAFLIACGSIAALGAWADASVQAMPAAATDSIVTLPTITVRPTPEEMRELQRSGDDRPPRSVAAVAACSTCRTTRSRCSRRATESGAGHVRLLPPTWLRSLRRNPALTALMVMAIGFGVAASMITWSVFRAVSGNPIPGKSAQLYTALIDNRGPQHNTRASRRTRSTTRMPRRCINAHKAKRQTLLYRWRLVGRARRQRELPFNADGYACTRFLPHVRRAVPIRRRLERAGRRPVARGGRASATSSTRSCSVAPTAWVATISLGGHDYRVVGVTSHWDPSRASTICSAATALPNRCQISTCRSLVRWTCRWTPPAATIAAASLDFTGLGRLVAEQVRVDHVVGGTADARPMPRAIAISSQTTPPNSSVPAASTGHPTCACAM